VDLNHFRRPLSTRPHSLPRYPDHHQKIINSNISKQTNKTAFVVTVVKYDNRSWVNFAQNNIPE
jgi:hypothetical protein